MVLPKRVSSARAIIRHQLAHWVTIACHQSAQNPLPMEASLSFSVLLLPLAFFSSNAFFGGSPFCGAPPFHRSVCARCFCCRPPPFVRPCCFNCQSPPVVPLAPAVPSPCSVWHPIARRCCPGAVSVPLPQQFPQQQLIMANANEFGGIAPAPFAVGGERAAQFPIGPMEAQHQIQPIIYVIENGKGGQMPTENESASEGTTTQKTTEEGKAEEKGSQRMTEEGKAEEKEGPSSEESAEESVTEESTTIRTTTEEEKLLGEEEQSNSTRTTTKRVTAKGANLKRKVPPGPKHNRRRVTVKTPIAEGKRQKQFDEMEGEAQALYDYEEAKSGEDGPTGKKKSAASKLFEMEFLAWKDKFLRGLKERKQNARQKRIPKGETKECNNGLMAQIMDSAIVEDSSISKRLIKRALKFSFPESQFDIICAAGGVFSYAIYGRRHCQVKRRSVTCLAFE
ncbi:hypothetical protein niasHS_010998 [Heterodera schachtii]|uniref:Ground-like domain-containing protein n=1 Tax=Heterodera schachtii TaxID=97005 RepID=A0ABD2IV41_HETSC